MEFGLKGPVALTYPPLYPAEGTVKTRKLSFSTANLERGELLIILTHHRRWDCSKGIRLEVELNAAGEKIYL